MLSVFPLGLEPLSLVDLDLLDFQFDLAYFDDISFFDQLILPDYFPNVLFVHLFLHVHRVEQDFSVNARCQLEVVHELLLLLLFRIIDAGVH